MPSWHCTLIGTLMTRRFVLCLIACWSPAAAQVRLEFPVPGNSAIASVLPLPGGGRLVVGSRQVPNLDNLLYPGGPSPHYQIEFTVLGGGQFARSLVGSGG